MKDIYLSVVIPSYDEMANLQKGVLDKIIHFFEKKKYTYEIIVVDDGSTDGSDEFVGKISKDYTQIRLIKNNHLGKAGAVTTGVLQAKGKYVLFTDMDQATPIEEVDKLLPFFAQEFQVVIGSRNNRRKGAPWTRLIISRSNMFLRKVLVGLPKISDTQCGFKLFEKEAAEKIFTKINIIHHGFQKIHTSAVTAGFDVEILLIAKSLGYNIKEVPVEWLYVETRRVNPVHDSVEGLRELFVIRSNLVKKLYS